MKTKLLSVIAAVSLAVTSFASLAVTASAAPPSSGGGIGGIDIGGIDIGGIDKGAYENVSTPTAVDGLVYDGTEHELVTWDLQLAPNYSAYNDKVIKKYSLTYDDFASGYKDSKYNTIPSAVEAGTYKVYYAIDGKEDVLNYDYAPDPEHYVTVTISGVSASASAEWKEDYETSTGDEEKDSASRWEVDFRVGTDSVSEFAVTASGSKGSASGTLANYTPTVTNADIVFGLVINAARDGISSITVNGLSVYGE